ncbi:MAG: tetratricopeptide repeat protein [Chitinophagaceae bacterium]
MPQTRQLAAIMFTDIVGYTALMGEDEQKAFEILNKNRQLEKPIIDKYHGKWVKELGDGVLASFNTVSDAVYAAKEIQEECTKLGEFSLRIGIHQGEIIFEGDDVFGDAVNVASRIQAIAPINGIYITEAVYNIISNKKEFSSQFVRSEFLKNVKDPLRIYQVLLQQPQETFENTSKINRPEEIANKSVAVLPFINMSNDPEQEYFSDGMGEELIANLSRLKDVRVISRTTSMQYKGTKKDIKTIGRELYVGYILEGSVRKFQDNLRITVQLIDVENDTHLWAETFKGKLDDIFDIQEEVAKKIVDALRVTLSPVERVGLTKRSTFNAEAYDYYLRARNFLYRLTKNNIAFAIQLFQKALELDGRYAQAYAGLAESYATLYSNFERDEVLLEKAIESGLKALMYDASLSEAHAALGLAYFNKGALNEALVASEKAIQNDPDNFIGYWLLGDIYHKMDQNEKALEMYHKVIQLNPLFCPAYGHMRMMYVCLGRRQEYDSILKNALENAFPKYLSQYPDDPRGHLFYAMESAEAGYLERANAELAKAIELSSGDAFIMYGVACFYAVRSEIKPAIDAFKKVLENGYLNYEWMKRDPDLDNIRNEPDFIELMKGK